MSLSRQTFTDAELKELLAIIPAEETYLREARPGESRRRFNCFGPLHRGLEVTIPNNWDLQKAKNTCPQCLREIARLRQEESDKTDARLLALIDRRLSELGLISKKP